MDPNGEFLARLIKTTTKVYAAGIVERQVTQQPDARTRYGTGRMDLQGDTELRLAYLAEALACDRPVLFTDQIAWAKVAMVARDVPLEYLDANLSAMGEELMSELPRDRSAVIGKFVAAARKRLAEAPSESPSLLEEERPNIDLVRRFMLAALETRAFEARKIIMEAADRGVSTPDLYEVLSAAQTEMGRMWQMNEVHVGEEHYSSRIVEDVMGALRASISSEPAPGRRVLLASISGNLHDIGIRAVADHFTAARWEPILLGASVPLPDLVLAAYDFKPNVIALSVSLALQVQETAHAIRTIRSALAPNPVPILVGGAPFRAVEDLWQVVGADAGAVDAASAVAVAERLLG